MKPKLLTGFGEINFGKQFRQGNRVYDSEQVAMCLNSAPVGNMGGYSYLYLVNEKGKKMDEFIKQYNSTAKHQQDLIQSEDGICRCIPAGTHGSTPHLLKTIVSERTMEVSSLQNNKDNFKRCNKNDIL